MLFVLDIRIYDKDIPSAVNEVINKCSKSKENLLISATGSHGIITAQKDENFRKILNSFYANLPDGMPGVWVGRLKGAKEIQSCYGPDFLRRQ